MEKRELLLSIGFSEEYISYLEQIEQRDTYISDSVSDDYRLQPKDVGNVIVNESRTDFITRVILQPK